MEIVMRHARMIVLAALTVSSTNAAAQVGFRQIRVPDAAQERGLEVAVWYPTDAKTALTTVGQNAVFTGEAVRIDAPPTAGPHPLVVLSHGYGGNWSNESWLAVELARLGYVVAAVNHPGTTTQDMDSVAGAKLWERPREISRTIDALAKDAVWSAVVASNVGVIGHSLGGWTVVELAGGRFDPQRLEAHCKDHGTLASCQVYRKLGAGRDPASRTALAQNLKDRRIKAVISLDLGFGQSFDPSSLRAATVPTLIIAAGMASPQIPAEMESRYVAELLPAATTRYVAIPGAAHFSFLAICRPGAAAILDTPDDAVVCHDGEGADRSAIHQQTVEEIARFLAKALPPTR